MNVWVYYNTHERFPCNYTITRILRVKRLAEYFAFCSEMKEWKTILHCDMNNFYASVECNEWKHPDFNPSCGSHCPYAAGANLIEGSMTWRQVSQLARMVGAHFPLTPIQSVNDHQQHPSGHSLLLLLATNPPVSGHTDHRWSFSIKNSSRQTGHSIFGSTSVHKRPEASLLSSPCHGKWYMFHALFLDRILRFKAGSNGHPSCSNS